jgi:hypothetical protein
MSMKKSNDTIENRIRDLPACRAVPQPNAPPRAPKNTECKTKKYCGKFVASNNKTSLTL